MYHVHSQLDSELPRKWELRTKKNKKTQEMISYFPAISIFQEYKQQAQTIWDLSKKFLSPLGQRVGDCSFLSLAKVNHIKQDNQATYKGKLEAFHLCTNGQRKQTQAITLLS